MRYIGHFQSSMYVTTRTMGEDTRRLTALVVGVTGMAGLSIAEALKSSTVRGGPWEVYGAARRPKPAWFPTATVDHYITFDATNAANTAAALLPLSSRVTHLFWVALQETGDERTKTAVNSAMLANVLRALTSPARDHGPSSLRHVSLQTGTQQYMGPVHDPAFAAQMDPPESPFREDTPRLPYPNFYHALEDVVMSHAPSVTYSIHRASIIAGASTRSVYNALLTISVYASICKRLNAPFRFPGTRYAWEHFCDMMDARVLADQHVWAAVTPGAQNEAFNCSNGDVFTWRSMWRILCDALGVEFVEHDDVAEFDWVGYIRGKGEVWDRIVEEHGLVKTEMQEIICPEALCCVMNFGFQHVCSMNKSREFGFMGFVDSFKSVRFWVGRMREMRFIP